MLTHGQYTRRDKKNSISLRKIGGKRVWVLITASVYRRGVLYNTNVPYAGQWEYPKNGILSSISSGLAWATRNSDNSYSEESYQAWRPCRQISKCKSEPCFFTPNHICLSSQCNRFFFFYSYHSSIILLVEFWDLAGTRWKEWKPWQNVGFTSEAVALWRIRSR